jgi:hypothetical protein
MTWFTWWATAILTWEGAGLLTGRDTWPPTITDWTRAFDGPWQAAIAIALMVVPFAHLVEWIA